MKSPLALFRRSKRRELPPQEAPPAQEVREDAKPWAKSRALTVEKLLEDAERRPEVPTPAHAERVATLAHLGQVDKSGFPCITHVRAVALALRPFGEDFEMAGWLHDVVEKTPVALTSLRRLGFEPRVLELVALVSRGVDEDYEEYIRMVLEDPDAALLKLAENYDTTSNYRLRTMPSGERERLDERYEKARTLLEAVVSSERQELLRQGFQGRLQEPLVKPSPSQNESEAISLPQDMPVVQTSTAEAGETQEPPTAEGHES